MADRSCSRCAHRQDVLVPCTWLLRQPRIITNCPFFEPREGRKLESKEEDDNGQHEV